MDSEAINRAATLLAAARRGERMGRLPEALRPASVAEAHAIQDAVTAKLDARIGAFKANAPASGEPTRGVIYADAILASPARIAAARVPQCGVEGEVAFVFRRDLPPREAAWSRDDIAGAVDACAAIEVVTSRYRDADAVSVLEKLADGISNGALVHGASLRNWRGLDFGKVQVTLLVNGAPVLEQSGGHPTGDPLGSAVALANMMRSRGVRAGEYVTCGSYTGLRYLQPGDTCAVRFEGLSGAEVTFTR
jgi:2-keto-4-pentenoate hydratase